MMVDKTGVGPEGEDVVADHEATDADDDQDPESPGEDNDSPPAYLKHEDSVASVDKCPFNRTKSNQRWMKLRTTVQLSGAISSTIQKTKPPLKREDSFLKRFSTRQVPETQETMDTGDDGEGGSATLSCGSEYARRRKRRRKHKRHPRTVVNPDENFYFYWLMLVTICVLYNLWTLIVRQSFPELQEIASRYWFACDMFTDIVFLLDVVVQFRTGYLEQGLMVYDSKKLAGHYIRSRAFLLDLVALMPLDLLQFNIGVNPILRFPRFLKVYRVYDYYYMVESRTVYPNLWRVMNLIHILLILAHWFGCFYYLLSEAEGFQGDWVYPYRPGDYATLTRKYLGSLYWSTLTLTTIGDLPTPETNAEKNSTDSLQPLPRRGHKSRLLQFNSNQGYIFTIVSYLIGVFIFATIVGQVGNVITNRNANRLEFERLLDGAKTYMRHHKVPGGMKRRVLRWYDYSWSRGRIQGGGDINTALGLLPDKLKTELALHVNLSVLKKVTIFHECQPEFLHDLVLKMKAYIFTPGDLICRKGEVAREMFIIADGILEVKSETGRVLTTMKAGDFFGEIGILNLDGLNRRTADVRSVGYSELFSLSREDVLAAMKDYPEAQDILQTLGRKRLMEARSINRVSKSLGQPGPEKLVDGEPAMSVRPRYLVPPNTESEQSDDGSEGSKCTSSPGSSELFDHKTGKRIVEKIRSDVKGLKNVLRKSRRGTRSKEECMELQPLTNSQDGERYSREGKGILCRMPRVMSEDTSQEDEPYPPDTKIGAGLPLLQRLKLLKEKQDKETVEKPKATPKSESSVPKEEEHEVLGPGLPLLQRLLLLKQKEDSERDVKAIQTTANETAQVLASTVRTQMRSPPLSLKSQKSKDKSKEEEQQPLKPIILNRVSAPKKGKDPSTAGKNGGVSWKDDCDTHKSEPKPVVDTNENNGVASVNEEKLPIQDQKKIPSKAKPQLKFQALLKQTGIGVKHDKRDHVSNKITDSPESSKNIESSDNRPLPDQPHDKVSRVYSAPGSSKTSDMKPDGKVICRVKSCDSPSSLKLLPDVKDSEMIKKSELRKESTKSLGSPDSSRVENPTGVLPKVKSNKFAQETKSAQSSNVSKDNNSPQNSSNKDSVLIDIETSSDDGKVGPCRTKHIRKKPNSLRLKNENKMYKSIEDLSPEYSGLPFVKQLRILNERHKLSEHEDKTFMRSSSLDSGHRSENKKFNQMFDSSNLTRSHSEAIAIEVVLRNQYIQAQTIAAQKSDYMETSTVQSLSPEGQLTSPESNETVERRHLKSILKKLSSTSLTTNDSADSPERQQFFSNSSAELRKLMRAQTVEGYAARHSKLTKSVTFNRDTLQSPPSDLSTPISDSKTIFQYSKISSSLEVPTSEKLTGRTTSSLDAPSSSKDLSLSSPIINDNEALDNRIDRRHSETAMLCSEVQLSEEHSTTTPIPLFSLASVIATQPSMSVTTETVSAALSQISELRTTNCAKPDFVDSRPLEFRRRPQVPTNFIERSQSKQKNFFRPGSILLPSHASQEEEFFAGILGGIKSIIQNHLDKIQGKFQTRFEELEMEVKKRDAIIAQLQERIQELENSEREESSDADEAADPPFVRADSVDTVLSSPRRGSARWKRNRRSWEDHSEEENIELRDLPESMTPQNIWNSMSIDMVSDSSSMSETDDVFHNDWEVQMLAKEMERRESLQKQDQDTQFQLSVKELQSSVRRRRAISFESVSRNRKVIGKRPSNSESSGSEDRRRTRLQSAQSLDERNNVSGSLSALYRRSLSISNLHSSFSNSLLRGLGTFVRGNVPTPTTLQEPSPDMVPTISKSCPPPHTPPHPPDI